MTMAPPNGAARRGPASSPPAPQSRASDPANGRRSSSSSNNNATAADKERRHELQSPPPQSSSSSSTTNAFLLYCVLPLLLLSLASFVNVHLLGGGGVPPPNAANLASSQSPGGRDAGGVTIDLAAVRNAAAGQDDARTAKQRERRARERGGGGGGGAGTGGRRGDGKTDSELQREIDALLEKQGKKPRSQDNAASQRHQRGGSSPAASREDQLEEARKRAKQQQDPRHRFDEQVERIRQQYLAKKSDVFRALGLADALRQRDLTFHDGGSVQMEAIETYHAALALIRTKRAQQLADGEMTNIPLSGGGNPQAGKGLNAELFLDTSARSTDGLLVSVECSLGKMYFMANMFENAVDAYDRALAVDADYLDALTYRASTLIILGRYEDAAADYAKVLELDSNRIFQDAYTGLSKILVAKESAVPGGWDGLVKVLEDEIPRYESRLQILTQNSDVAPQQKKATGDTLRDGLKRMHLAMFSYHDTKTNKTDEAWHHLSTGYRHKMDSLNLWNAAFETQRVQSVKQVFHKGFWPLGVGSQSRVPIFIIGFVRSGSTLTERVLDAHPDVVGTGEDSVFNGRLDEIRNRIVEASMAQGADPTVVQRTVLELADMVVDGMRERFHVIDSQVGSDDENEEDGSDAGEEGEAEDGAAEKKKKTKAKRKEPKRFADKMLTNYMNVGFIHMLFPNALILHVARNPMDTCFSAYKHDFPPGTLDYTSDFASLADLYQGYRDVMDHWDEVLPGRVTHIKYEDMVNDMPNVAPRIIAAAGLEWHPDVLQFHKKKQAVNTLSTTQVRKGVYKHHLQAWKKYGDQLRPLVKLLGKRARFDIKTTLPGYVPLEAEASPPKASPPKVSPPKAERA